MQKLNFSEMASESKKYMMKKDFSQSKKKEIIVSKLHDLVEDGFIQITSMLFDGVKKWTRKFIYLIYIHI